MSSGTEPRLLGGATTRLPTSDLLQRLGNHVEVPGGALPSVMRIRHQLRDMRGRLSRSNPNPACSSTHLLR